MAEGEAGLWPGPSKYGGRQIAVGVACSGLHPRRCRSAVDQNPGRFRGGCGQGGIARPPRLSANAAALFRKDRGVNRSAYFTNRNSSKRSVLIDLKHPEGLAVAKKLATKADVIVNSFRGGVLEALGLGFAAVSAENPGVIHLSMPMTLPAVRRPASAVSAGRSPAIPASTP